MFHENHLGNYTRQIRCVLFACLFFYMLVNFVLFSYPFHPTLQIMSFCTLDLGYKLSAIVLISEKHLFRPKLLLCFMGQQILVLKTALFSSSTTATIRLGHLKEIVLLGVIAIGPVHIRTKGSKLDAMKYLNSELYLLHLFC